MTIQPHTMLPKKQKTAVSYLGDNEEFSIVCCYCGPERGGVPILVRNQPEKLANAPLTNLATKVSKLSKQSLNEKYKVWFFPEDTEVS